MLRRTQLSAIGSSVLWCASGLWVTPGGVSAEVRVLDPVGVISAAEAVVPPAPRPATLAGKKVWVVVVDNGSALMPAVAALLPAYAPGVVVKTILTSETGNPFFMLRAEDRPDAVIAGTGVCESTTVDAVSYAKQAEKRQIPAVVLFLGPVLYAHRQAMDKLQFPGVRAFGTELPDPDRPADPERLARQLVPRFVEGLTRPVGRDRPRIGFTGPEGEARAYFESLGWTGGLAVALPTEERVGALLRATSHRPDEVIGVMAGARDATVEKVAVHAAMAGCTPGQMPLALAMASMMCRTNVAEELSQREPPALQLGVSGKAAAATGAAGSPEEGSLGRLARLMLIHLGGMPGGTFEGKELRVARPGPVQCSEGTVSLLDEQGGVWKDSTTAVDGWR